MKIKELLSTYETELKDGLALALIVASFAGGIALGIKLYKNHQRFEEETRQAKSKLASLITNEHVSISNDILRVNANGTNYDFCIEYQGIPKKEKVEQKTSRDYRKYCY